MPRVSFPLRQVLPHLLKLASALITGLTGAPESGLFSPSQLQREALGELLQVVLACDDYTRKPALVSFYQSLSLVVSTQTPRSRL